MNSLPALVWTCPITCALQKRLGGLCPNCARLWGRTCSGCVSPLCVVSSWSFMFCQFLQQMISAFFGVVLLDVDSSLFNCKFLFPRFYKARDRSLIFFGELLIALPRIRLLYGLFPIHILTLVIAPPSRLDATCNLEIKRKCITMWTLKSCGWSRFFPMLDDQMEPGAINF